jgi:septin family protein
VEAENAATLASAREDAEGLARKIALLEGELAEERWARELAEVSSHGFSDTVTDAECWREVSERERRVQFKELTLL